MSATYITVAQTAKLVRAALKAHYPGVTFSVRSKSYSMGASITVDYTDGPATKDVEAVVKVFEGATFDGMTDYKGGLVHALNGQVVHFGADYIFVSHHWSEASRAEREAAMPLDGRTHAKIDCNHSDYWVWFTQADQEISRRQYPTTRITDAPVVLRSY